jgi:hypothetical protein
VNARSILLAALWCGLFPGAGAGASETESFNDPQSADVWSFNNGPEWPGARGTLERRPQGGRNQDGVLVLEYNFERGGSYVAAIAELPTDRTVHAVRFWVNKPAANLMTFRATDSEGETFQKSLRFDFRGWQQLEIALNGWVHRWGGDGKFQQPARQFHILIENRGGNRKGELLIDDVQWVYEPTRPDDPRTRTATYTESTFASGDGWRCRGPAENKLDDNRWMYRFDEGRGRCSLRWGKSILGRPTAIRLTVQSDGSGHELRARCGSHFQSFERALGTLDSSGERVFEASLGDMSTWTHFGGENDGIVRYPLRLEELALVKRGTASAGELILKRLEFTTEYDRDQPVTLIPRVARDTDGRAVFTAELRSLHDQPLAGRLRYSIGTLDQIVEQGSAELVVPPSGRTSFEHVASCGDHSLLEGVFEFVAEEYATGPQSITIANAPEAPDHCELDPGSRMGVGLYLYRFQGQSDRRAWLERTCRLAAAAGVKWTREEFNWKQIEVAPGEFDFRFYDELVETARAYGISIYGLVCYGTDWGPPLGSDEFVDRFCDYLRVLVDRYKDRIKHWEIWNEPNIFFWPAPKERYPVLLERAYETIKDVDPTAEVLGCSTAGIDSSFIKMVLEHGARFDALTVHPYRADLDPQGFIRELRDVQDLVGGRDVWITEMGWPSQLGGLTEREQAGYVSRTYIAALACDATRTVAWYDFREDGADPFYNEHHFGLVRQDLTPKIGYLALATVGRLLGSAEFEKELSLPGPMFITAWNGVSAYPVRDDLVGFLFRQGERRIAAIWSPNRTRMATFKLNGENVQLLTVTGEALHKSRFDGSWITVLEQDLPVYAVSEGELEIDWSEFPLAIRLDRETVHPGETVTYETYQDALTTFEIQELPDGWTSGHVGDEGSPITITVPADARPGRYEVIHRVKTLRSDQVFLLPVAIDVVPTLLRG